VNREFQKIFLNFLKVLVFPYPLKDFRKDYLRNGYIFLFLDEPVQGPLLGRILHVVVTPRVSPRKVITVFFDRRARRQK